MTMIEAQKLRKVFGPIEAVKGVSFKVNKGEVLGFLGPNGAGKTTVMRMLTCFLTPTAGTAKVGGHDILNDSMAVRRMVGYVPESSPLYGDMTPQSFLKFMGEMRGYRGEELKRRVDSVIERCWLGNARHQAVETLSKGYMRRVGLAQSLLHDPPILILDEPTDGLDPNQKHEVRTLIRQMAAEKCIVISTHILEEVDAVCTRAIIIAKGAIVADETPGDLKARSKRHGAVRLGIVDAGQGIEKDDFKGLADVAEIRKEATANGVVHFTLFPKRGEKLSHEIMELVHRKGWEIEELSIDEGDLNEVFRAITMKEGQGL